MATRKLRRDGGERVGERQANSSASYHQEILHVQSGAGGVIQLLDRSQRSGFIGVSNSNERFAPRWPGGPKTRWQRDGARIAASPRVAAPWVDSRSSILPPNASADSPPPCSLRRLRSFLTRASRRIVHGRTSRIDGRQADIVLNNVRARRRIVSNIDAGGRWIVDGDLHGRVSDDKVLTHGVPYPVREKNDSVRIPDRDVVHYLVVYPEDANAEVTVSGWYRARTGGLGRVTISTQPVRTEPVAAAAARQSYASTWGTAVPVSYRRIRVQVIVGRWAKHNNPGRTVRRRSHLRHEDPSASSSGRSNLDSMLAKSLDDSRALNHRAPYAID